MTTRVLTLAAGLALTASMSLGQLVTPPTKAPEPEKDIPVAPPPPMPMPMSPDMPIQAFPEAPKHKPDVKLPDLPYKSLVEKDAQGKLKPLSEPMEYAALKRNPMLKPEDMAKFDEYMKQRRASFEVVVADNVDLVQKVEDGFFEKVDLSDKKNYTELINVAKPLKAPAAPKPLYDDLREKHLLTDEQSAFNRKISGEYHQAAIAEVKADATRSLALYYKQGLDEPVYIHHLMLVEAAKNLDAILPAAKLDAAAMSKVQPTVAKVKAAKTDEARLAAMQELGKGLTVEQQKAMLHGVIEKRAKK